MTTVDRLRLATFGAMNLLFRNNAHDGVDQLDIIGDIGESWFSEGHTMGSVKDQLKELKAPKLVVNVSSLGGNVNDALAIHDLIKMHPAKTTVNITGLTASSGTIVALAGDEVRMSENALFLVHNAWTGVVGNQHDMEKAAEELKTIDSRLVNIYKKKTGKSEQEILDLMKEERWISADEAKEFGFIDSTFEPMAIAASVIDKVNAAKEFPNIVNNQNQTDMNIKEEFKAFKDSIMNAISELKGDAKTEPSITEVKILDQEEVKKLISNFETKVTELEEENKKLKAEASKVATVEPTPEVDGETKKDPWAVLAENFRAKMYN